MQVTMVGTVVADPELRFTPAGAAVANFRVASNKRFKRGDEWVDGPTTYLTVNAWRQMAENVAETLQQGTRVVVTGELNQRSYDDREGNKRYVYEVTADEVAVSLRWATAKVSKVGRTQQPKAEEDPWADQGDKPPF